MDLSREVRAICSEVPEPRVTKIQRARNGDELLETVVRLSTDPELAVLILNYFQRIVPEICSRWDKHASNIQLVALYGNVLPLAPYMAQTAQHVLLRANSSSDLFANAEKRSDEQLLSFLVGLLRLLRYDNTIFGALVQPVRLNVLLNHRSGAVRYVAVRLMCRYLHASDNALQELLAKYCNGLSKAGVLDGGEIDFAFFDLWEQKRIGAALQLQYRTLEFSETPEEPQSASLKAAAKRYTVPSKSFSRSTTIVGGAMLPKDIHGTDDQQVGTSLIPVKTTVENLSQLVDALLDARPTLVTGPPSSAKTTAINHVAVAVGAYSRMITLHLNEQSDAKSLLGMYTAGTQPGSFEWQPGVLTKAVREGRWVLVEDIDRAPNEVMSVLAPLLERRQLRLPGHSSCIQADAGFKLIATLRTIRDDGEQGRLKTPGSSSWLSVPFCGLAEDEITTIVKAQFPALVKLVDNIVVIYHTLWRELVSGRSAGAKDRARPILFRDLLKWCTRIDQSLKKIAYSAGSSSIPDHVFDGVFLDAIDCFLGWRSEEDEMRTELAALIASQLAIDPKRRDHLLQDRVPNVKRKAGKNTVSVEAGRSTIVERQLSKSGRQLFSGSPYSLNKHSSRLMEQISLCLEHREPLLLVGETGIGKTTSVQHLASMLGQSLLAINLSQQSEASDLVGGFKPVSLRTFAVPLMDEFDSLFQSTFSQKKNAEFSHLLGKSMAKGKWRNAVSLWKEALKLVDKKLGLAAGAEDDTSSPKRRKLDTEVDADEKKRWLAFSQNLSNFERRLESSSDAFAFAFVEGKLVKAVKEGGWVLLDEINLASPDTLECLSDLLETGASSRPSIILTETGSTERIVAHPNFRIIAAMNPSTDIGKRDLAPGIRSRFTEIFVDSPDRDQGDLENLIRTYLCSSAPSVPEMKISSRVASMYIEVLDLVKQGTLLDGSGQKPHFSLRTLTRSLQHATSLGGELSLKRRLYEGFAMCFLTILNQDSFDTLDNLIRMSLFQDSNAAKGELRKVAQPPSSSGDCVSFKIRVHQTGPDAKAKEEQHWLPRGPDGAQDPAQYIVTPYISRNLKNLIRASSTRRYPVLIQGPTSAGKTSMIEYLAQRSGNRFVRINNHEHTDLQEYIGTYVSGADGKIVFQEGVLVEALRSGYWVVLDELNLAPTDILEALNRLLDDNRELFIPETQEIVKPHPNFMLFATQNPVGAYGGRKILSRAFRNRFLELHFDDIPVTELNTILSARSNLPQSWCSLIIEVYKKLARRQQEARLFDQNSFATLRDLFRWAFRGGDSMEQLALNGYMLLGDKTRKKEERDFVRTTIEQVMSGKGVRLNLSNDLIYSDPTALFSSLEQGSISHIVWTKAMRRLSSLVVAALKHNEPILLVGETGGGKTTICQLIAYAWGKRLYSVNAHQNMETGDIIGAQRPIRNRAAHEATLTAKLLEALNQLGQEIAPDASSSTLLSLYNQLDKSALEIIPAVLRSDINDLTVKLKALFEWHDGTLVQAMREGNFFLLDEISLADDSVLERMNSVLDPQKTILLAEKGARDAMVIAQPGFQFLATMNPGGDFGKKELSPALRNRFTEIWVPPMDDEDDILQIVEAKLKPDEKHFARHIVSFAMWFHQRYHSSKESSVSMRDMLTWTSFVNMDKPTSLVKGRDAVVQGALMVYVDTLGANPSGLLSMPDADWFIEREACLAKLGEIFRFDAVGLLRPEFSMGIDEQHLRIGDFAVEIQGQRQPAQGFQFETRTTAGNGMRLLRGLQMDKPTLIEGAPGVGKTSLVNALAAASGHTLTRINLSDQTDLMDLFGSDVPVEDAEPGVFAWRDAPFLKAMKTGGWVLLDEMNLASQPILEGLNACIDHRGEVYVPELDQTFKKHPDFRLFAAQNPQQQGGGRKGLPLSFVNRFTVIYAEQPDSKDLVDICRKIYPSLGLDQIRPFVSFAYNLLDQVNHMRAFGSDGGPWEFNLRDALRCLSVVTGREGFFPAAEAQDVLEVIFARRFRNEKDSFRVQDLIRKEFGNKKLPRSYHYSMSSTMAQFGFGVIPRRDDVAGSAEHQVQISMDRLWLFEAMAVALQCKWPLLLVGQEDARTTDAVRSLSAIAGAKLEIISISNDLDASDLIGSFEQSDPLRNAKALFDKITEWARLFLVDSARRSANQHERSLIKSVVQLEQVARCDSPTADQLKQVSQLVSNVVSLIDDDDKLAANAVNLGEECESLLRSTQQSGGARFQWVDSALVKAVEEGHWLLLENANLCNASVLDRLNSLLEQDGKLIINEHCAEDGTARAIEPHPNFRIFLTLNPRYGEVSRAMRNRALELFVPVSSDEEISRSLTLNSSLSRFEKVSWMLQTPAYGADEGTISRRAFCLLSLSDLSKVSSFCEQASRGLSAIHGAFEWAVNVNRQFQGTDGDWTTISLSTLSNGGVSSTIGDSAGALKALDPLFNQSLALVAGSDVFEARIIPLARVFDYRQVIVTIQHAWSESVNGARFARLRAQTSRGGAKSMLARLVAMLHKTAQQLILPLKDSRTALLSGNTDDFRALARARQSWQFVYFTLANNWDIMEQDEDSFPWKAFFASIHRSLSAAKPSTPIFKKIVHGMLQGLKEMIPTEDQKHGLGMELVWHVFKPSAATTTKSVDALLKLEELAADLDRVAHSFYGNVTAMADVRQSLVQVAATSLQSPDGVTDILRSLSASIKDLSIQTRRRRIEERSPHFLKSFQALQSTVKRPSSEDKASPLDLLSQKDIQLLSLLAKSDTGATMRLTAYPGLPRSFQVLYENLAEESGSESPLALPEDVCQILATELMTVEDVPLDSVSLLRTELDVLGRSTVQQCGGDNDSPISRFAGLVIEPLQKILRAHESCFKRQVPAIDAPLDAKTSLGKMLKLLVRSQKPGQEEGSPAQYFLKEIISKYLAPGLAKLVGSIDAGSWQDAGVGIVVLALGCIIAYVPSSLTDPVESMTMDGRTHDWLVTNNTQDLQGAKGFEKALTGCSENLWTSLYKDDIKALGPRPPEAPFERPDDEDQVDDIDADFEFVIRNAERVGLLMMSGQMNPNSSPDVLRNLTQLVQKLSSEYRYYDDIVVPVVGFLLLLKLGILMFLRGLQSNSSKSQGDIVMPFVGATLSQWHEGRLYKKQMLSSISPRATEDILKAFEVRASLSPPASWPVTAKECLSAVLQSSFKAWKQQLAADKKTASAASNIYHYRGGYEDEQEDELAEFNALFPDYEDDEEGQDRNGPSPGRKASGHARALPSAVAKSHLIVFLDRQLAPPETGILDLAVGSLSQQTSKPLESTSLMVPLMLSIRRQQEALQVSDAQSRDANIYTDYVLPESLRLRDLATNVHARSTGIRETWPEHATLGNICQVCAELLAFKHTEPLIKLMTKTEQLHGFIAEWQTVASREYSMADFYTEVTNLIVHWRRLELSTWSRLLSLEAEKAYDGALSWFYVAYENIVFLPSSMGSSAEDTTSHVVDVVSTVEGLLRASSAGQYMARLDIIDALRAQLAGVHQPSAIERKLAEALSNLVVYFRKFCAAIQLKIDSRRKELEAEIKDVIQLASWRDVNILALKQSAKASHRKLFTVVRKFRQALSEPIGALLMEVAPSDSASIHDRQSLRPVPLLDQTALKYCQQSEDAWKARPVRYQRVQATLNAMEQAVEGLDDEQALQEVDEFTHHIVSSVDQLRKATPSILSEENSATVKHLLSRKRRLYADTLKTLKDMGFRYIQTPAVLGLQKSLSTILSNGKLFDIPLGGRSQEAIEVFSASLDAMNAARPALAEHTEDLSQNDVSRSFGFCEAMLAMTLKQHHALANSKSSLESLHQNLKVLGNTWSENVLITTATPAVDFDLTQLTVILTWLPSMCHAAAKVIQVQTELASRNFGDVQSRLASYGDLFASLSKDLANMPKTPEGIIMDTDLHRTEDIRVKLHGFEEAMKSLGSDAPYCKPVLEQLLKWTSFGGAAPSNDASTSAINDEEFNTGLYKALDQVLGVVERVKAMQHELSSSTTTGDDDWLVKLNVASQARLDAFNINKINSVVADVSNTLQTVHPHQAACASVKMCLPIFEQYRRLYEDALSSHLDLHCAVSKMHYKLTKIFTIVASSGFCKPAEKSNEQDKGRDKIESGTGLGEGEGSEDISKDIAEDEDLSELAQDPGNANAGDQENKENKDDAVDIEDDMKGATGGDAQEQDEEDGGKKSENGDEEQHQEREMGDGAGDDDDGNQQEGDENAGMDEDVGDVDEDEPSAIDEKFWDQAGDEDQKEKDGKQSAKNKNQDDQAAGKDDAGRKDEQGSDAEADVDDAQDDADRPSDEGSDSGADDAQDRQEHRDVMDPHADQAEELDLPDDLNLDPEKNDKDADESDVDMLDDDQNFEDAIEPDQQQQDDAQDDGDAAEEEESGDIEAQAQGQDNDLEQDQDDARDDAENMQDSSSKPYANEQQGDQDMDPSGTAQGQDGNEKTQGNAQGVDEEMKDVEGQDNEDQDAAEKPEPQDSKQPAGSGDPGNTSSSKAPRDSAPQAAQEESIKKLGDILEQWHRRQRQINEQVSKRDEGQQEQQDVDVNDADFEHLPDEDAQADAQALGTAKADQARALDDKMGIPDQEEPQLDQQNKDDFDTEMKDAESDDEHDDDGNMDVDEQDNKLESMDMPSRPKSMVGDQASKQTTDRERRLDDNTPHDESDSDDDQDQDTMSVDNPEPESLSHEDATTIWTRHESQTNALALVLTEQLRLILTPTQATKLRGDFRTGKRLNLKRIIPYIASSYRRDKIWLRRSAPSKRNYQVMLAIDDSSSMRDNGAADLAFSCLALVSRALALLEAGELGVVGFGERVFVAHPLGAPFASASSGPAVVRRFAFSQTRTDVRALVARSMALLREARARSAHASAADLWQLQLVLSDGICEDHAGIRRLLLEAAEERVMFVFVIVDAAARAAGAGSASASTSATPRKPAAPTSKASSSIVDLERVEFAPGPPGPDGEPGPMRMVRRRYLDTFPFRHFLVVRDVRDLPDVLAGALRSWFAEVAES